MVDRQAEVILATALRRHLGPCKNCGRHPDNLQVGIEEYDLVARCLSCGRNNLPSPTPPSDVESKGRHHAA